MMLVDSFGYEKSSKNKNISKSTQDKGDVVEKRPKRLHQQGLASIVVKLSIGRGTTRPTQSQRRSWHVMHHHLQVFMSLRLILFLLTTYGYMIPVVAHTYGLICKA